MKRIIELKCIKAYLCECMLILPPPSPPSSSAGGTVWPEAVPKTKTTTKLLTK